VTRQVVAMIIFSRVTRLWWCLLKIGCRRASTYVLPKSQKANAGRHTAFGILRRPKDSHCLLPLYRSHFAVHVLLPYLVLRSPFFT